jgi:hypothetical protein
VEVKLVVLAGFSIALVVFSVVAGIQVAYYFGHERTLTTATISTTTLAIPVSDRTGNFQFFLPLYLEGNISWNTTTISQNQTMEANLSIINPTYLNTTITAPYAECMSEVVLSLTNGSQVDDAYRNCTPNFFNETMTPGRFSNVSYVIGFSQNLPPNSPPFSSGNVSDAFFPWSLPDSVTSDQYTLTVEVGNQYFGIESIVIPVSIFSP